MSSRIAFGWFARATVGPENDSKVAWLRERSTPPASVGLSHMTEHPQKEGVIPACGLDFLAHRYGRRMRFDDVGGEPSQDSEVLRCVVFSRSAAVLIEDDVENPMQLVLDAPPRTYDRERSL